MNVGHQCTSTLHPASSSLDDPVDGISIKRQTSASPYNGKKQTADRVTGMLTEAGNQHLQQEIVEFAAPANFVLARLHTRLFSSFAAWS